MTCRRAAPGRPVLGPGCRGGHAGRCLPQDWTAPGGEGGFGEQGR